MPEFISGIVKNMLLFTSIFFNKSIPGVFQMIKKLSVIMIAVIICFCSFSSCKQQVQTGEEATIINNSDSALINEDYSFISEQISVADSSKSVISWEKFNELINNPDLSAVSYDGTEDIVINNPDYIDKSVVIKTSGSFTLESPVKTLIAERINGAFSLKAKADNVILKGEDLTVDIGSDTGNVYIEGKNAVINVSANTEKIFAHNVAAIINNYSENTVTVTLANGTQTQIEPQKSYDVHKNLIFDIR